MNCTVGSSCPVYSPFVPIDLYGSRHMNGRSWHKLSWYVSARAAPTDAASASIEPTPTSTATNRFIVPPTKINSRLSRPRPRSRTDQYRTPRQPPLATHPPGRHRWRRYPLLARRKVHWRPHNRRRGPPQRISRLPASLVPGSTSASSLHRGVRANDSSSSG